MQKIRDEFMSAQNELDSGNEQPIIDWWNTYRTSLPTPMFEKSKPAIQPSKPLPIPIQNQPSQPIQLPEEYDEMYDWKTDTYMKVPRKVA